MESNRVQDGGKSGATEIASLPISWNDGTNEPNKGIIMIIAIVIILFIIIIIASLGI